MTDCETSSYLHHGGNQMYRLMQLCVLLSIILPFFWDSPPQRVIADIPMPPGYSRLKLDNSSFGQHLRSLPLRNQHMVRLYNGLPKLNQSAQYAVADLDIGTDNLVQCADMIMMIRAQYLFERGLFAQIRFLATDGTSLEYSEWLNGIRYQLIGTRLQKIKKRVEITKINNRKSLDAFLHVVYQFAGTLSLSQQLVKKKSITEMIPGDVLLQGGSPGHAVLVMDMAVNPAGRKIYLLMQGYMPAQDIHVLNVPGKTELQPWYSLISGDIHTPEWTFYGNCLYGWQ
jgi:hypothetical protein